MAAQDWDFIVWRRANDLLQQAERIHRNFLQIDTASQYRAQHGRTPSWEPPVNVVETDENLWVISALAGVAVDRIEVRLEGRDLVIAGERPLPPCCRDGELNYGKFPSVVLSGDSGWWEGTILYRSARYRSRMGCSSSR